MSLCAEHERVNSRARQFELESVIYHVGARVALADNLVRTANCVRVARAELKETI